MERLMQAWFSGPLGAALARLCNMSAAAGALICVVVLLRFALRGAPKWTRGILWAIVAVQLVCPIVLRSPLSVYRLLPRSGAAAAEQVEVVRVGGGSEKPLLVLDAPALAGTDRPVQEGAASDAPAAAPAQSAPSVYLPTAGTVWLAGFAAMLFYALTSWLTLRRRVRASVPLEGRTMLCDGIGTPFILGLLRPRVYLPSGLNDVQRSAVLAHENAHLRRRDHWWKPLGFLLLSVHWFNPLVWLAYVLLCRDIELACDEKAVRDMDAAARIDYSQALLDCAAPRALVRVCPLAFGEVGVKERVKRVLNYKKPAFWIVVLAIIICAVVAVCFLTRPEAANTPEPAEADMTPAPELTDTPVTPMPEPAAPRSEVFSFESFHAETAKTYVLDAEYSWTASISSIAPFYIILDMESGMFQYYENPVSSYFGIGVFTLDGDILTMDDSYRVNRFRVEDERLIWIEEGSDNFWFVKLADGAAFSLDHTPVVTEATPEPAPALRSGVYEGQYFSIRIDTEAGSFRFSEADYSSHLSDGLYGLDGDVLTIRDPWPALDGPVDRVNRFRVEDGKLVWLEEGSDNFVFVTLTDGATFRLKSGEAAVKRRMTFEDVRSLSEKGTALTWDDLLQFEGEDVGSGLFIYRFPVGDSGQQRVEATGGSLTAKPTRVRFQTMAPDGSFLDGFDIRDGFYATNPATDAMLLVESGGTVVAPYPLFLNSRTWDPAEHGWLAADGVPTELEMQEHTDEIPTLTLGGRYFLATCWNGARRSGNLYVYGEDFTLLRSGWPGDAALNWLAPGTYYCAIDVRGPVGAYIEEADDFEQSAYRCVFRAIVTGAGPAPYAPEEVHGLTKASLRIAWKDYDVTDAAALAQLEDWLHNAEPVDSGGGASCGIVLTLTRADGSEFSLCPAEDGPLCVFSDGQYYRFDGDRTAFYELFGILPQ